MRILRAVVRALVAASAVVTKMVWQAGRRFVRCLPGYQPPAPVDVVNEYVNMAETAAVEPQADQRLQNVQLVADALFRQQPIADALLVGLSSRTLEWLEAMSPDMLLATARATPDALRAHIAGTKAIRGLLAYDPAAVEAYSQAVSRDAEPELVRSRQRPRLQGSLLSAFRPIA